MGDAAKSLVENHEFLSDFARYSEKILDEKFLRRKYHFVDDDTWTRLGQDDALVEAIELEKVRRVRSGQAKRERAQVLIAEKGPQTLDKILSDPQSNAKHKIDAVKVLDDLADNGPQAAPAGGEHFTITINLGGGERLVFGEGIDNPRKPGLNDDGKVIEHVRATKRNKTIGDIDDELPLLAIAKKDHDDGSRGGAW